MTLLRNQNVLAREDEKVTPTIMDMGAALVLAMGCYVFGQLVAGKVFPTIFGAAIHEFAYLIIFVVILAATGIVPKQIWAGAYQFCNHSRIMYGEQRE